MRRKAVASSARRAPTTENGTVVETARSKESSPAAHARARIRSFPLNRTAGGVRARVTPPRFGGVLAGLHARV